MKRGILTLVARKPCLAASVCDYRAFAAQVATFRRKKPFLDDRATDLGARTRRHSPAARPEIALITAVRTPIRAVW